MSRTPYFLAIVDSRISVAWLWDQATGMCTQGIGVIGQCELRIPLEGVTYLPNPGPLLSPGEALKALLAAQEERYRGPGRTAFPDCALVLWRAGEDSAFLAHSDSIRRARLWAEDQTWVFDLITTERLSRAPVDPVAALAKLRSLHGATSPAMTPLDQVQGPGPAVR